MVDRETAEAAARKLGTFSLMAFMYEIGSSEKEARRALDQLRDAGLVESLGSVRLGTSGRPPRLYRFIGTQ